MIGAAIGQTVDQPGIAVEGKDDRLVPGEEDVEVLVGDAVRVLALRLQRHQIHDIDDADLQFREVLAQDLHRRQRLQRRHVTAAGHDHIGIAAFVVAGPLPDAESGGAVFDRSIHVQPLQFRLLARDDDIDIIVAAQAMVGDRQQGVGIGRQIDADDFRLLVCHHDR